MARILAYCIATITFGIFGSVPLAPDSPASAPRLDSWRVIGPGGGGSQYHPTVSPYSANYVIASCDMTGMYLSVDGGNSWRIINLRETINFLLFDPADPKTIYASTTGLWRSKDSGITWELVIPKPDSVLSLQMPDDHASVRFVTSDGIQRTVLALAVDPLSPNLLYAGISEAGKTSLFVSTDRGESWTADIPLPGGVRAIYVDPHSRPRNRNLYLVGNSSVEICEAGHWRAGTPPPGTAAFVDVSLGFPRIGGRPVIYAVTSASLGSTNGIFISEDGGMSWRQSLLPGSSSANPAPQISAIATSLYHPDVAYVSYSNLRVDSSGTTYFGVAKTDNRGRDWQIVWKEAHKSAPNVHDIWISERFGPGWGENPVQLGVGPHDPSLCFGTDWGRTMRTTDGGATWEGVYSRKLESGNYSTTGLDVTTCYGVHFDPFGPNRVFISYTDIGLFGSEDGGVSWFSATRGVPSNWVNTTYWMEFDPEIKSRAWAAMSGTHDLPRPKMWRQTDPATYKGGVCLSNDGGKTWNNISVNLPATAATHILIDPRSPSNARVLYVAGFGKGVFKSMDGGKTWDLKNQGLDGTQPLAWRMARDRDGALYLVLARRSEDGSYGNDKDGALYRSMDGAEHWEKIKLPSGLNGPNGITADPMNPDRLYLSAWGRKGTTNALQGGIFLSSDRGLSWRNVLDKDQHIYDVTVDPRDPFLLYACGFESSAWRSSDRGETWQRIRGYNFKWGHRVVPDPMDATKIFITTFGGSVWYGPATGDPSAREDIITSQVAYQQ